MRQLEQQDNYIIGRRFKQISGLEQEYELREGLVKLIWRLEQQQDIYITEG